MGHSPKASARAVPIPSHWTQLCWHRQIKAQGPSDSMRLHPEGRWALREVSKEPPMTYQGFAGLGPGWVLQKKNTPDAVCAKCFCLAWVTYNDFLPFCPFKSGKVCSESYYNLSTTCKTSADHQLSPNSTNACKKQGEGKENQYINSLVLNS